MTRTSHPTRWPQSVRTKAETLHKQDLNLYLDSDMNIRDDRLYCYLPGSVLRALYGEPPVLDKLMDFLKVPAKNQAQLKRLPVQEKQAAIERQVSHLRSVPHSPWHDVEPPEVVAASIWRSHGPKQVAEIFSTTA